MSKFSSIIFSIRGLRGSNSFFATMYSRTIACLNEASEILCIHQQKTRPFFLWNHEHGMKNGVVVKKYHIGGEKLWKSKVFLLLCTWHISWMIGPSDTTFTDSLAIFAPPLFLVDRYLFFLIMLKYVATLKFHKWVCEWPLRAFLRSNVV